MDTGTTSEQEVYERELRELRKAMGCTPERLMDRPALLSALRHQREPGDDTIRESVETLKDCIERISDPKYREPLLVALHLDAQHRGNTLAERRKSYRRALERSRSPLIADVRTLERRENKGIRIVARLLAEGQTHALVRHPRANGPGAPTFSRDLAIDEISQTCYFTSTGSLASQEVVRRVRAVVPGADPRLRIANKYLSESRSGVLRVESGYGCRVLDQTEVTGGAVLATLEIFQRLDPEDGPYPFACRILVNSTNRCQPVVRWRPPVHPARRVEFKLVFDPAMTPLRAWWFEAAFDIEGQIEPPTGEGRHLPLLDDGQYVCKIFEGDLTPSCSYGIAWLWP